MSYERLRPVQYDEQAKKNVYRPKFPWKKALVLSAVVTLILAAYFWRQRVRGDAARAELQRMHAEQIQPVLTALGELRADIEEKAETGQAGAAERRVESGLKFSDLHGVPILYARVRAVELRTPDTVRASLVAKPKDAIGACLGLEMTSTSALYDVPDILQEKWLTSADETNDMLRLNIRHEQLEQAIHRELPALSELTKAAYLLLAVVQGHERDKDPVDLFLWDLRSDTLVLRSRTEARGRLIAARSQIGSAPRGAGPEERPLAAADCSIAAHLKAITGEPVEPASR